MDWDEMRRQLEAKKARTYYDAAKAKAGQGAAVDPARGARWPQRGQTYTLTEDESGQAIAMATRRFALNRMDGVADKLISSTDPIQNDIQAYGAEIAFCRMAGSPIDTGITIGKFDTVIDGLTIDVKQTRHRAGMLMVAMSSSSAADIYVLMVGELPTYRYVGCCERGQIISDSRITDHAPSGAKLTRPAYALAQAALLSTPPRKAA